jgi:aryl-alcohol dehydrogenase-like predicted oxidoreductase
VRTLSSGYHPGLFFIFPTIHTAFEIGINFFDTAYGEAENLLGKVVKPYRNKIYPQII